MNAASRVRTSRIGRSKKNRKQSFRFLVRESGAGSCVYASAFTTMHKLQSEIEREREKPRRNARARSERKKKERIRICSYNSTMRVMRSCRIYIPFIIWAFAKSYNDRHLYAASPLNQTPTQLHAANRAKQRIHLRQWFTLRIGERVTLRSMNEREREFIHIVSVRRCIGARVMRFGEDHCFHFGFSRVFFVCGKCLRRVRLPLRAASMERRRFFFSGRHLG